MKHLIALLILFPAICCAQSIRDLVLDGGVFDGNWELTQPNIIGQNAAPNYIDRTKEHQPVVMIQIIHFANKKAAEEKLKEIAAQATDEIRFEKIDGPRLSYERVVMGSQRMRMTVVENYWITVEQVGKVDDRQQFIEKYTEHVAKKIRAH